MTTLAKTVQLTLEGNIYYKDKCIYCGKGFNKTENKQLYCSDYCRTQARKEQKAAYQRKRRKLINQGVLIVQDTEKAPLGSSFLSKHAHNDFTRERNALLKEKRRLGL